MYRLGDSDPLYDAGQVRAELASACESAGSQKAFAALHGLSETALSEISVGRREPSKPVLAALGYERVTMYRRARI